MRRFGQILKCLNGKLHCFMRLPLPLESPHTVAGSSLSGRDRTWKDFSVPPAAQPS